MGNNNRKNKINIPIELNDTYAFASRSGSKRANTLDPSRGGIGSKLKIAKRRFMSIILIRMYDKNAGKNP